MDNGPDRATLERVEQALSNPGRVPLLRPFTPSEAVVVELVIRGNNGKAISEMLDTSQRTTHFHVYNAARKIPGNMTPVAKIEVWGRCASVEVLTGVWIINPVT
ncbi:MAG: hypothetical protein H0W63_03920 [Gemmatimonadaceae bacterium]|nr:hypothetical protein [Gemmatimonadaceae bacterium]